MTLLGVPIIWNPCSPFLFLFFLFFLIVWFYYLIKHKITYSEQHEMVQFNTRKKQLSLNSKAALHHHLVADCLNYE